jgi:polygalacturonase
MMTTRNRGFMVAVLASLAGVPACGQGDGAGGSDSDSGTGSDATGVGLTDAGAGSDVLSAGDVGTGSEAATGAEAGLGSDAAIGADTGPASDAETASDATSGSDATTENDTGAQVDASTGIDASTGMDASKSDAASVADAAKPADATAGTDASSTACGAGDTNLPAEPTMPAACATLHATQNVATDGVPSETTLDTATIQAALKACASGQAVKLTTGSGNSNNSFITGPLTIPTGVSLWVDAGTTLFGTRNPTVYGSAGALISVGGANSGIVGEGVIDGQGGEPMIGSTMSFWDQNGNGGSSPALIGVSGATNFTLYNITLHNSPMFHVKLSAKGFIVWGITIKTPSKATNSVGTALTVTTAHNTDGVDPGESASNGYIVCNKISDGDDHIAIKGSSPTGVTNLTIAHNHFEAGHGMSIGSEFTGGVSDINVYDLSIDGSLGGYANGIRIKSDSSRGGLVNNVTYSDVCVRDLQTPILLTPMYSTATGNDIPQYTNIKIQNFHALAGPTDQLVTLDGYSASVLNSVTLDNVIVDGITAKEVTAEYTKVTLGPGNVNFTPSGTGVTVTNSISGTSTPNACTGKWVTF